MLVWLEVILDLGEFMWVGQYLGSSLTNLSISTLKLAPVELVCSSRGNLLIEAKPGLPL